MARDRARRAGDAINRLTIISGCAFAGRGETMRNRLSAWRCRPCEPNAMQLAPLPMRDYEAAQGTRRRGRRRVTLRRIGASRRRFATVLTKDATQSGQLGALLSPRSRRMRERHRAESDGEDAAGDHRDEHAVPAPHVRDPTGAAADGFEGGGKWSCARIGARIMAVPVVARRS